MILILQVTSAEVESFSHQAVCCIPASKLMQLTCMLITFKREPDQKPRHLPALGLYPLCVNFAAPVRKIRSSVLHVRSVRPISVALVTLISESL